MKERRDTVGTVIVINRSTLTDSAAVARVGLYLSDQKELAEVDGIKIQRLKLAGYGEKRKFLVTDECQENKKALHKPTKAGRATNT